MRRSSKKDNDFFIYILGKNFDNLGEEFKIPLKKIII